MYLVLARWRNWSLCCCPKTRIWDVFLPLEIILTARSYHLRSSQSRYSAIHSFNHDYLWRTIAALDHGYSISKQKKRSTLLFAKVWLNIRIEWENRRTLHTPHRGITPIGELWQDFGGNHQTLHQTTGEQCNPASGLGRWYIGCSLASLCQERNICGRFHEADCQLHE
jgi:hypothetical protein